MNDADGLLCALQMSAPISGHPGRDWAMWIGLQVRSTRRFSAFLFPILPRTDGNQPLVEPGLCVGNEQPDAIILALCLALSRRCRGRPR